MTERKPGRPRKPESERFCRRWDLWVLPSMDDRIRELADARFEGRKPAAVRYIITRYFATADKDTT